MKKKWDFKLKIMVFVKKTTQKTNNNHRRFIIEQMQLFIWVDALKIVVFVKKK